MLTTHPRRILAALALAATALTGTAGTAAARTAKPAGPVLTIESKTCNTGTDAAQRNIVLTASAVLRGTGDEVQMRFTVQQRAAAKTSWRTVFAKTGDLGTWATSDAGADGLRYTKTINGLAEGTQYRVVVDARGVSDAGKVVTKTSRKLYTCLQPQLSARLIMTRAEPTLSRPDRGPFVRTVIRNLGRATSAAPVVTVRDATSQAVLGTETVAPLEGRQTAVVPVPITGCTGKIIVTVQQAGDDLTQLTPEQSLTVDCATATAASRR